jgi:hypothetical protein
VRICTIKTETWNIFESETTIAQYVQQGATIPASAGSLSSTITPSPINSPTDWLLAILSQAPTWRSPLTFAECPEAGLKNKWLLFFGSERSFLFFFLFFSFSLVFFFFFFFFFYFERLGFLARAHSELINSEIWILQRELAKVLDERSAHQKDNTNRHPCFEWDSSPISKYFTGREYCICKTARPLWSGKVIFKIPNFSKLFTLHI